MAVEISSEVHACIKLLLKATVCGHQLTKNSKCIIVLVICQTLCKAVYMQYVILFSEQYNESYILIICIFFLKKKDYKLRFKTINLAKSCGWEMVEMGSDPS